MRQLETIQTQAKLNEVFAMDEPGPGNASHLYRIMPNGCDEQGNMYPSHDIKFQNGPRKDPNSIPGVLDVDLLEIVRDRLKGFQSGDFACEQNAMALSHVEEALMWMNRRVEDRLKRQVLGTNEK